MKRVILIVLDGCGAGAAPDAAEFGDSLEHPGNTLVNTAGAAGGLEIPNLRSLGLGNLLPLAGGAPVSNPKGNWGRLTESSKGGKDTVTGHWEMMGIRVDERFPTYPQGFPSELMEAFELAIGRESLGNYASSGTTVLEQLGFESARTGFPIVYTSADSVFQIAAHEEVVPPEKLYEFCLAARGILQGKYNVQRVIARPFEGPLKGPFRRTERRKDFPLNPPHNVIDALQGAGVFVAGIGVIPEVFASRGFSYALRTQNNPEHMSELLRQLEAHDSGFFFVNFEDFDMLYGHRNDPAGFARCLEEFDVGLGTLLDKLNDDDLLLITADHGNDPTVPGTDHTREYAPILLHSPSIRGGHDYEIRSTFADIGATVAHELGAKWDGIGLSLIE